MPEPAEPPGPPEPRRPAGLLDRPDDIAALAPRYEDEILYRLLRGPVGSPLRQAARSGESDPIRQAVTHLGTHYADRSLRISDLASVAGLSPTTFFARFRSHTGLTPSQYLKTIRLQQARRLLTQGETAAITASRVGYASPTTSAATTPPATAPHPAATPARPPTT